MAYHSYQKETAWKIIYSRFNGVEKRAVELLSRELGEKVNRAAEVYTLHVLPCEIENESSQVDINAIVIGTYSESALIRGYVTKEEAEANAYIIKVVRNPQHNEGSIVLITSEKDELLYRAAARFLDDYTEEFAPLHGGMRLTCELFKEVLKEATIYGKICCEKRSIFAWGHAINNYREFIRHMARQGLNQLILWNDYAPLNAEEIVDYAHSFGIEIIWGYAWGWSEGACSKIGTPDKETLRKLKIEVLNQYDRVWRGKGDGIYFQSFTEMHTDNIDGLPVAKTVTDFVNDVAKELYKRDPSLHLQFGLHATSVKEHAEDIARVDPRIEILWEDCGVFPYAYVPQKSEDAAFEQMLAFTEKILTLRPEAPVGLVFKGFATLDWTNGRFIHQRGSFILGDNTTALTEHDRRLRSDAWRNFDAGWIKHGEAARKVAEFACKLNGGRLNLCMAGLFDGGIYLSEAICTEIFENPERKFEDIVELVGKRKCVRKN